LVTSMPGQHPVTSTQARPAEQSAVVVQRKLACAQKSSSSARHRALPSVLRPQEHPTPQGVPGGKGKTQNVNAVVSAGQVLRGKQEPSWQTRFVAQTVQAGPQAVSSVRESTQRPPQLVNPPGQAQRPF
jgi:hypothetical protein